MIWIILSYALYISCVSCGTEYTLDLTLIEPYASESADVYFGKKLVYDATATFAEGETTEGVVIEIITSITSPTVFAIGEIISYTKGSVLSTPDTAIDSGNFESFVSRHKAADYVNPDLKQRFDNRAVVTIGRVTSSGAGVSSADNEITIRFEAVYVTNGGLADGSEYALGLGMEYHNGSYIWIATDKKNLKDGPGTGSSETTDPTFDVSTGGDTNMAFMTPKQVNVTMYIPRSASRLQVEAVVMNNTAGVYVQEMKLTSVGDAYVFSTVKENIFTIGYDTCPLSTSLALDLGTPINKESKEASPDTSTYAMTVAISFIADNRYSVGSVVTVGFGVDIDGLEVWIYELDLTVTEGSEPDFTTFTSEVHLGEDVISPGFAGGAEIVLTIPRGSNHNYTIDLSTKAAAGGIQNALSIIAVTPTTHGNNIPCSIPQSDVNLVLGESVPDSGVKDSADLEVNISNTGMQPQPDGDSDLYRFLVYVMMMPGAPEGELFQLGINVRDVGIQYVVFTGGPLVNYTDDVNYSFTLDNDCGSTAHFAGSTLVFKMTVETERNVTAGSMTIEAPIPANVSVYNVEFQSAKVTSKGLNVVCLALGGMTPVPTGSGTAVWAALTIPLMCNKQIKNDTVEDKFVVEIRVTLKDVPAILNADTTDQEEFGIGVKILNKIWVACYGFNTKAPIIFPYTKRINGVIMSDATNMGDGTWPAGLKFQWSDDNLNYFDFTYSVVAVGTDGTTYALEPPLYARYARLISTDGDVCTDYSFDTLDVGDDIAFTGEAPSSEIMLSKVMFLLDNDPTTCMTLPTPASTGTVQYYWGNFITPVLGGQGNESFSLQITGNGLACNDRAGPQLTMVMFPDNSDTLKFKGRRRRCTLLDEIPGTPMTCKYECACSDAVTCADVSLLLSYNGSPAGAYELCDVKVVP